MYFIELCISLGYISQVLTLLNELKSQVITLLYGQEITSTATVQQQNAGLCLTQTRGHATHRMDKGDPYCPWYVYVAIGK